MGRKPWQMLHASSAGEQLAWDRDQTYPVCTTLLTGQWTTKTHLPQKHPDWQLWPYLTNRQDNNIKDVHELDFFHSSRCSEKSNLRIIDCQLCSNVLFSFDEIIMSWVSTVLTKWFWLIIMFIKYSIEFLRRHCVELRKVFYRILLIILLNFA